MDDISIDRLVLDIPGLSAKHAEELSRHIGEKLAEASPKEGDFGDLTVELNEQATSHDLPRLAQEIVDSMLRQIG